MIDGLVIGIFGTLLGTIGGLSLGKNIQEVAGWLEKTFHISVFPPDIYYIDRIPFQINPTDITLIIVITLTVRFLATVFPCRLPARSGQGAALWIGRRGTGGNKKTSDFGSKCSQNLWERTKTGQRLTGYKF